MLNMLTINSGTQRNTNEKKGVPCKKNIKRGFYYMMNRYLYI